MGNRIVIDPGGLGTDAANLTPQGNAMNDRPVISTTPLLVMGIVLAVMGGVAIAAPAIAGTAVVLLIGSLMLLAGIAQVVAAIQVKGWSDKLPMIILGAITAIAGLGVLAHPLLGLSFLALLLTIFFVVEGVWKIVASFSFRPATGWIALLISGLLTLALGIMIWMQWPLSGLWATGVLVGVNLLFTGVSLIGLAMTLKQAGQAVRSTIDAS